MRLVDLYQASKQYPMLNREYRSAVLFWQGIWGLFMVISNMRVEQVPNGISFIFRAREVMLQRQSGSFL